MDNLNNYLDDVVDALEIADEASQKACDYAVDGKKVEADYYLSISSNSYLVALTGMIAELMVNVADIKAELTGNIKA